MSVLYFAYGSNMATSQMQKRISSAKTLNTGYIRGWKVICNKRSKDGSGKANIVQQNEHCTWGVVYEIDTEDVLKLDRFEGGYNRVTVFVTIDDESSVSAETYISEDIIEEPVAFDWYKELIIIGAEEHGLPPAYVDTLREIRSRPDPLR